MDHIKQDQHLLIQILVKFPFYSFTVSVNRCGESCNTIDYPDTRVCVQNKVKNMNVKTFNLMPGVSETRLLAQHESCKCKSGFNESACNSKQKWNMMNAHMRVKN